MYRIKYNNSTIFDPYDDDEVVTDAKLTQEVNAAAYLDFTISPKHPLYDTVKERDGVVTLEWLSNDDSEEDEKLFEGIIDAITINFYGYKEISCVSAMDYLNDTVVRPYSTVAGEQTLTAPSSIEGYFQWLIDQHNSHVIDSKKRFGVGINQGASMRRNDFIYRSSTSNPTTSEEISNQILESLGGYLVMRYENGNNVLDLYSDVHEMNAQIIDFGVNLLDFTKTIDTADQYTALIPQGGSPKFTDGGFEDDDSVWNQYPYLNISTDQKHSGDKSAYFTEGNGEFINSTFFYVREGYRYKSTVWVKNERSSAIKVYPRYQVFVGSVWETRTPDGVNPLEVPNDNEWHEFTFDFLPHVSETTKIRPYWVFDSVANDSNKRVYVDDFNFVRIQGEQELEEDPITVSQMGDGITPFSYDIVKYHDVVYSLDAVQRYGYREKVFSDDTITDEDTLMQEAIRQLNMVMSPTTGIDIKAIDLAMFMKGYKHLQVGQAVRIRSKFHDTDEYLMVSSVDLDLQDPSQTEYELGKAYDSLTGQQSGFLMSLNSGINSSLDAVASLDQTTKDQAIQIGSIEQVANQAQQTANNAQNIANDAQQTANSNKEAIDSIEDAQTEYEKQLEQMQQGVEQAEQEIDGINDRLNQMDTEAGEVQAAIDAVRQEAQTNFKTAKAAADAAQAKADAVGADLESFRTETGESIQNVKQSVSDVQSDVDAVEQKAADLASELDGTKATVEQVTTDLGEVKTTVSNAATKADQALQVSTSASQTATEARTTATSAYQDAQSALTQSSVASQTANAVKTELETKYSTTDEIAEQYATKSLVEQTSQSITSTVEATYATKATVEALENIANNAVQTWMGSGVPTLSNKPASDWNTADLKSQHSGDIYYDTDTGYSYRFGSSDGKNYSWSLIKDTDISKAVADAAKAQQTAEGVSDEVTQLKTDIPATYATKTEVKQTTDSIKSSVSEVATTANSALSKATTVEQTAKGLQTTVTEQAEKLDGAVTTISQVSQKVDSVSSTITQVSGRVDDVEDKADAAQGTANSALSQASRVEQSLDSFKTSVSRDYQTKTEALSQKSELEQNLNSFKTTVSETYTTKDEFNALEIGGTNLLQKTNQGVTGWTGSTNGGKVTINKLTSPTKLVDYPQIVFDDIGKAWKIATYKGGSLNLARQTVASSPGQPFTLSFDAACGTNSVGRTVSVHFMEGDGTDKLIEFGSFSIPKRETWYHYELTGTVPNTNPGPKNQEIYFQLESFITANGDYLKVCNLKLEKGTKATEWSPAPEDFDGKYTSKTEFKQTTDKISATATAASQNASSALSKVSSLEVSVDGIDAKVEEVASDADEAVKTASQVSQRVDSLSSTITQVSDGIDALGSSVSIKNPSFETGDLTDWTTDGFAPAKVSTGTAKGKYRFEGLVSVSSGGHSYLRSSNVTLIPGHTYRLTVGMAYLDQNANVILCGRRISDNNRNDLTGYSGTFGAGYWHAISGKITVPSDYKVEDSYRIELIVSSDIANRLVCDDFSITDITDAKTATDTANSALSKSSSVEQSLNSFKTSVSQTYETKSDASSKQSSLQQSVNNLRTEVSETYLTKTGAQQTYSTKSYVDQTSRTVSLGVVEEYKKGQHGSALATQADITATKDSITSTVSQTYVSKTDASNTYLTKSSATATYATKTQVQQTSDSLTVKITETLDVAKSVSSGGLTIVNPSFETGDLTGWLTDFGGAFAETSDTANGSYRFHGGMSTSDYKYLKSTTYLALIPGHKYRLSAAMVHMDATGEFILCVRKMSDNSRINAVETTYGNTPTWRSPSGTFTIPSGNDPNEKYRVELITGPVSAVNQRFLCDGISITDVTDASNAQSTANTANSNAQNAQNRVGNLETCIKMTAQGVRVGKISNGNFTGYSALVNSAGSFDILDGSGTAITRFTTYGMEIPSSNNGNRDGKFVLTSSGYDLSFVKNGTTYYFRLGSGGIGIHASDGSYVDVGSGGLAIRTNNGNYVNVSPNGTSIASSDGSYISMSKSSGFALDSKAFGKLACGSNGLQFTNDQGWGLSLSVAGWSIKWAGNHTLATGNEAGALYIDGRRIQVA